MLPTHLAHSCRHVYFTNPGFTRHFTLTDDARLAAMAVAEARVVSAVEGDGPIIWESIVLVGRPTGSLM